MTGKINGANPNLPAGVNYSRNLALKNSSPFFNCILKVNGNLIEDAQDLDVVMPLYNLLYYSKNFRKTTAFFWNYYHDMPNSVYVGNNERTRVFYPINGSENCNYKTKLVAELPNDGNELEDVKTAVPLKILSNFMFNLDFFLLINAEIELILKWTPDSVLTEKATSEAKAEIPAQGDNQLVPAAAAINTPSNSEFNITDCKLYFPVVTLQTKYQNQLSEELRTGMSVDFTWSKWQQTATNNLNYLIDPTFNNVNRLFVLDFENE